MKLVSFSTDNGDSYGIATEEGIIDAGAVLGEQFPDLRSVLAGGALGTLEAAAKGQTAALQLAEVRVLPVIPNPGKIMCIGINYESHRQEIGREKSDHPTVFIRFSDTLVGHDQPILKPRVSDSVDFEGELAVIIGRPGRAIPTEAALNYVAGYSCFNDISIRDWQRHTGQFSPGKNFPSTAPFGPWMVTSNDIANPHALELITRVNGEEMQKASTDDLTFGIPELINYISTFTPLSAGDVISTGTPGGVGAARTPPIFLKHGDNVQVEIAGIGVLQNPVENE